MNPEIEELKRALLDHKHNGLDGTKPLGVYSFIPATLPGTMPATAANYGIFFIATRSCFVKSVSEVHTTAGTNGGAVTLQIERLQGTEAPDAGDALLTTAFDLKGTANTVQEGILVANKTLTALAPGDRLCLKDAGTLTDVAGLNVTVQIQYGTNN